MLENRFALPARDNPGGPDFALRDAADLELREFSFEDCPHLWQVIEYKFYRKCRICHKAEHAKMVFEGD